MAIWFKNPTPEILNEMSDNTIMEAIGIQFTGIEGDTLRATMPVHGPTMQPFGLLHGGASAVLAETLGSTASHLCIDEKTHYSVGLELNCNHIRAKTGGVVTGVASPIHVGRGTHVWEIKITDERDKIVCISRLTCMIQKKGQGNGLPPGPGGAETK